MTRFATLVAFALLTGIALPASAGQPNLDHRVDLQLEKAEPAEMFKTLARLVEAEVVFDPAIRKKITIRLQNVRLKTAFDAACDSLGCRWELQPGPPPKLVVKALEERKATAPAAEREPIDLKVTGADVRDLVKTFGQLVGATVQLDPALAAKVTLNLEAVPWEDCLNAVCKSAGCEWTLSQGNPPVLKVTAKAAR